MNIQSFGILFKGRLSSELNLIFMKSFPYHLVYYLFFSMEFDLVRILISFQSYVYFVNTSLFLSSLYLSIYFIRNKIESSYTMYVDVTSYFGSNIRNVLNSNVILIPFVYFNLIWIKVFNINHVVIKIIRLILYIYFFDTSYLYDSTAVIFLKYQRK